jgi:hypothetical protein
MADSRPYHIKVRERAGQGMRLGLWAGFGIGAYMAITAATGPGALLMAPIIGGMWMLGGAAAGAAGGLLFGAVRHSRVFDPPRPEQDRVVDLAAIQQRVQDALVPEQELAQAASAARRPGRSFVAAEEARRAARAATVSAQR